MSFPRNPLSLDNLLLYICHFTTNIHHLNWPGNTKPTGKGKRITLHTKTEGDAWVMQTIIIVIYFSLMKNTSHRVWTHGINNPGEQSAPGRAFSCGFFCLPARRTRAGLHHWNFLSASSWHILGKHAAARLLWEAMMSSTICFFFFFKLQNPWAATRIFFFTISLQN